jgi:hypothetical protein
VRSKNILLALPKRREPQAQRGFWKSKGLSFHSQSSRHNRGVLFPGNDLKEDKGEMEEEERNRRAKGTSAEFVPPSLSPPLLSSSPLLSSLSSSLFTLLLSLSLSSLLLSLSLSSSFVYCFILLFYFIVLYYCFILLFYIIVLFYCFILLFILQCAFKKRGRAGL